MELRQLKYFVILAETLNFSEAAKKLYITQGTLSQQIKELENEAGVPLFERTSHSVFLTEAGAEMLPLARQTLESAFDCRKKMTDLKENLCGTLNIGVTHSFSGVLTDTLKEFIRKYPGVKLNIHYKTATDLVEMLHRREVDFILAFKPSQVYEQMESEPIFNSKLSVVMRKGHELSDRKSLSSSDLAGQGIILPGARLQSRRAFDRFLNVDTSPMDVRAEINDPIIILDLLQGTNLVSILSSLAIYYRPNLVAIPLTGVNSDMVGCIHWMKEGYRKRSANVFVDMLKDSAMIERICMNA